MCFWLSLFNINITYRDKDFKEEYFFYLLEKYAKPSSVLILIPHILRM